MDIASHFWARPLSLKLVWLITLLCSLLLVTPTAFAETGQTDDKKPPASSAQKPNAIELGLASPRDTMKTFLGAMNDIKRGNPDQIDRAIETLDATGINLLVRTEKSRDLAWILLEILDRTRIIDLEDIPAYKQGDPFIVADYPQGTIRLVRQEDGRWLFSAKSLKQLPAILDGLKDQKSLKTDSANQNYLPWHIKLKEQLPEYLRNSIFLLENWQWLGILLVITIGVVADKLGTVILDRAVRHSRVRAKSMSFQELPTDMLRPFGLMLMAIIWWLGLNMLGLPEQAMIILLVAVKMLAGISGVWGAYRLVDLVTAYLVEQANATDNKMDDVLIPLISKTLKVFVTVIGIIFVAANLNLNVTSLLASVGLGGLAFALAAKDVVQNLFGSITVLLDRTFDVGDWIIAEGVEGSVEEMGLRSTRIRTFYNSVVIVPNALFITANVDNMGKRRYRRLKCNVSITYDTPPEKIEAFCEGIRELVRLHPYMRKDYYHIYLNTLAASSLDVLVYVFWETPDWATELRERHRFLLDILRLAHRLGVSMAFPTQTIHLHSNDDLTSADHEPNSSSGSVESLMQQGRDSAKSIVNQTTGLDQKPPPVTF